jgi:hypothetical protein
MDLEFPSAIALSDEDMEVLKQLCLYEKELGRDYDPARCLSNALRTACDLSRAECPG